MSAKHDFDTVFSKLKSILAPYRPKMVVAADTDDSFYLDAPSIHPQNKKPIFFGAVRKGKAYVSFYLMPVYMFSELLDGASPELRKRMQGKSCFNFKAVDDDLFDELIRLTQRGFTRYRQENYV
jgi:hypothetical protein